MLIFFKDTCMMLYFRFLLKIAVITNQSVVVEQALHRVKNFSTSHAVLPVRSWRCTMIWEGTEPGQLAQTDQRGVQYCIMWCLTLKAGERGVKGGVFKVIVFVFLRNHCTWWTLLSWKCLLMGNNEWGPYFEFLACSAFVLPNKLPLFQPMGSCTFPFPVFSLISYGETEQTAGWYLAASCGWTTTDVNV